MMSSPSPPSFTTLWRALIDGYDRICRAAPGYEAHFFPDSGQILTGAPHADMNFAFVGAAPDAERHLRLFHARALARGLPMLVLSTESAVPHLEAAAASLGLTAAETMPLMVCLNPRPSRASPAYTVERIQDPTVLNEATPLAARTFGLPTDDVARVYNPEALNVPGVDYFIARRDGGIWSFVQTARIGSHVGIWSMATPPEYQGQGAGRALLDAALTWHRQQGVARFHLLASSAGRPLYERFGFQEVARIASWFVLTELDRQIRPPTSHPPPATDRARLLQS